MKYINEMCISSNQDDMIRGSGKKVMGKYGYSNQGYIQFDSNSDVIETQSFLEEHILIMVSANHAKF